MMPAATDDNNSNLQHLAQQSAQWNGHGHGFLLQKEDMKGGGEIAIILKKPLAGTVYPQAQWPRFGGPGCVIIPVINILSRNKKGIPNINPL